MVPIDELMVLVDHKERNRAAVQKAPQPGFTVHQRLFGSLALGEIASGNDHTFKSSLRTIKKLRTDLEKSRWLAILFQQAMFLLDISPAGNGFHPGRSRHGPLCG